MTRITRYVLAEVIKVFGSTLAVMTLVMILAGVLQEAVRRGLGVTPVMQLIPYVLPDALRFAVPGTILFASSSVYGRMSAANEIVAIKALGISPMVMIWPALVLSFILSLVSVWLNDVAVSWGRRGVQTVVLQSLEQIVYDMLRANRSYGDNQISITVMGVEDETLIRPTLTFFGNNRDSTIIIRADKAVLKFHPEQGNVTVRMFNGNVVFGDKIKVISPDWMEETISLSLNEEQGQITPSHCSLREIPSERTDQVALIRELEESYGAELAFELAAGDFSDVLSEEWDQRHRHLRGAQERLYRLHTEPWRRWANGFSCFFFVLVGAPLAVRMRNADLWTCFGLCFLPILFAYYPLLAFGVERAKAGDLPSYSVWLGNVVLTVAGVWISRRVIRY